jgi:hypothetical protein
MEDKNDMYHECPLFDPANSIFRICCTKIRYNIILPSVSSFLTISFSWYCPTEYWKPDSQVNSLIRLDIGKMTRWIELAFDWGPLVSVRNDNV